MKSKAASHLLIAGAVMVLLASLTELTIEREFKDALEGASEARIEQKIDTIWSLLSYQYSQDPKNSDRRPIVIRFGNLDEVFGPSEELSGLQKPLYWIKTIRVIFQLLGGVLILLGTAAKSYSNATNEA